MTIACVGLLQLDRALAALSSPSHWANWFHALAFVAVEGAKVGTAATAATTSMPSSTRLRMKQEEEDESEAGALATPWGVKPSTAWGMQCNHHARCGEGYDGCAQRVTVLSPKHDVLAIQGRHGSGPGGNEELRLRGGATRAVARPGGGAQRERHGSGAQMWDFKRLWTRRHSERD